MMEYRVEKDTPLGWEVIAENCNLHSAMIMCEALKPRADTTVKAFKELSLRVVNSAGEVQD